MREEEEDRHLRVVVDVDVPVSGEPDPRAVGAVVGGPELFEAEEGVAEFGAECPGGAFFGFEEGFQADELWGGGGRSVYFAPLRNQRGTRTYAQQVYPFQSPILNKSH